MCDTFWLGTLICDVDFRYEFVDIANHRVVVAVRLSCFRSLLMLQIQARDIFGGKGNSRDPRHGKSIQSETGHEVLTTGGLHYGHAVIDTCTCLPLGGGSG